jgi:hypothetical protein
MPDEKDEPTEQERSFFRSWFGRALLVVVPALIAGVFSIAPKLYDELTKPRAALSYTQTSGPAISTNAGFRQIFSLTVENAGKVPLTGIDIDIRLPTATQIESSAIEPRAGLSPVVSSEKDSYRAHLDRLLPTEMMGISIMTISNALGTSLTIALRSNEVLGAPHSIDLNNKNDPFGLFLSAALAALSVGLAFLIGMTFLRAALRRQIFRGSSHDDNIRFIAALSEVPMPRSVFSAETALTYIATGDLFLDAGLNGEKDVKDRCVLALRALLATSPTTVKSSLEHGVI